MNKTAQQVMAVVVLLGLAVVGYSHLHMDGFVAFLLGCAGVAAIGRGIGVSYL
jgi:hypothetical protein